MQELPANVEVLRSVIAEALLRRTATVSATRRFVGLGHNDVLCPGVQERLDQVLQGVSKRVAVAADIQGPNDRGVDVLVTIDADDRRWYIGIQVKSDVEALDRDLLKNLKAGYVDAIARYGGTDRDNSSLLDYYIFLAWDVRKHQNRVRRVSAELATYEAVRIVSPSHAWAFFANTSRSEVDAMVSFSVTNEDHVLSMARRLTKGLSHGPLATLLLLVSNWIGRPKSQTILNVLEGSRFRSEIHRQTAIVGLYSLRYIEAWMRVPEGDTASPHSIEEDLAIDLAVVESYIAFDDAGGLIIDVEVLAPILAIAYDAYARYDHQGDALALYMFDLITAVSLSEVEQQKTLPVFAAILAESEVPYEMESVILAGIIELNCPDLLRGASSSEQLAKGALQEHRLNADRSASRASRELGE